MSARRRGGKNWVVRVPRVRARVTRGSGRVVDMYLVPRRYVLRVRGRERRGDVRAVRVRDVRQRNGF